MKIVVCKECGREHILVSGEKYVKCERCGAAPKSKKGAFVALGVAAAVVLAVVFTVLLIHKLTVENITVDSIRYKKTGDFYTAVGFTDELGGELIIPDTVKGVPVAQIGEKAFSGSKITALTVGAHIRVIGGEAFADCDALTTVNLSEGLEEIGNSVFYHCDVLVSADLPDGIKKVGNSVYYSCRSLSSARIPSSVTELGMGVFSNCHGLCKVQIENGIEEIPYTTFENCTKLIDITLPASVKKIGEKAFYGAARLEKITLLGRIIQSAADSGIYGIGRSAFAGCMNLAVINYCGSEAEWLGINKFEKWDLNTGVYTVVFDYSK